MQGKAGDTDSSLLFCFHLLQNTDDVALTPQIILKINCNIQRVLSTLSNSNYVFIINPIVLLNYLSFFYQIPHFKEESLKIIYYLCNMCHFRGCKREQMTQFPAPIGPMFIVCLFKSVCLYLFFVTTKAANIN
jgi:hypothetical protein